MARSSREYSEEDAVLAQADELLFEQDRRDSFASTHSRRSSSGLYSAPPAQRAAPRTVLLSYTALVVLSTCAARQLARLARISRSSTLALPLANFLILDLTALAFSRIRPGRSFSAGGPGAIELGKGVHLGRGAPTRGQAWLAGAAAALALNLRFWELRAGQTRLSEALEVFTIPAFLALAPYFSSKLPNSSVWYTAPSTAFMTAVAAATFLVGFALIGVPASGGALALGLLRVPLEAAVLAMLKDGLTAEAGVGWFLTGNAMSASLVSIVLLPFAYLFTSSESGTTHGPSAYASFSTTLLLTTFTQIALLYNLSLSTPPLAAVTSVFPRNFLLLIWSTLGREGVPLRTNWMQEALVYACGTAALLWTEPDLYDSVTHLRRGDIALAPLGGHVPTDPPSPSSSPSLVSPNQRKLSSDRTPSPSSHTPSILSLVPFIPLFAFLITTPATTSLSTLSSACAYLPPSFRSTVCPASTSAPISRSVDLVVAYYDEDLAHAGDHIAHIRQTKFVRRRSNRVVVYNKGARSEQELRQGLKLKWTDEVVPLPNLGREGATYLMHILLHYNSTLSSISPAWPTSSPPPASLATPLAHLRTTTLADHTYFLQAHLAWDWIAKPRLEQMADESGFAHFGPLVKSECGYDARAPVDLPVVKQLYNIFAGEICPPEPQLAAWSAQMAVSKRRILAQPYARYAHISALLEAPAGHWIHAQWGPNESGGPSNPAFGHSVERAWPVVFGCKDGAMAERCPDEEYRRELCQCLDT
ncbi:hypothetical protein JCM10450v2_004613 [Rhodotorula kratochvilovae]